MVLDISQVNREPIPPSGLPTGIPPESVPPTTELRMPRAFNRSSSPVDGANLAAFDDLECDVDLSEFPPAVVHARPQYIRIPGPANTTLELSAHDFLRNLESLAYGNMAHGAQKIWRASFEEFGHHWEIAFRGNNRASIRVFTQDGMNAEDAVRTLTEAAGHAFPASKENPHTNDFHLRVVPNPAKGGQIVIARNLPAIPLISSVIKRLFELELATHSPLLEQFEFKVPELALDHQSMPRKIDILVSYRYGPKAVYPDFLRLDEVVRKHFTEYPESAAYWETVNRALVRRLLSEYEMLESLAITVMVHPDKGVGTSRASTVVMNRAQLALEQAA